MIKKIRTIRYMGNKSKLLSKIIPLIISNNAQGICVCDLMAGTNTVAFGLKDYFKIITNDTELFSKVISDAIICNSSNEEVLSFMEDFHKLYEENLEFSYYSFFKNNYSDKYFSEFQCIQIDSIRFALEKIGQFKDVFLTALMYSMSLAQSTPGHFAQFLPANHIRVQPLRKIDIYQKFKEKLFEISKVSDSKFQNDSFNLNYYDLLNNELITEKIDLFYIDPPYTADQYSRFYHLLDTVVRYDNPILSFKAGYRNNRFQSNFSYKSKALIEFDTMISKIYKLKKDMILSYSTRGIVSIEDILRIIRKTYGNYSLEYIDYKHSKQGNGNINVKEVLIYAKL